MRIFYLLILVLPFTGVTQTILDSDNQWVYKNISMTSKAFVKHFYGADTTINGNTYKTLASVVITYYYIGDDNWIRQDDEVLPEQYLRTVDGEIVYWDASNERDVLLYPENISVGQTWELTETTFMPCGEDFAANDLIEVNEQNVEVFSGEEIITYLTATNGNWSFGNKIYKGIGGNTSFFPQPSENCEIIDNNVSYPESLVCFTRGMGNIIFNDRESEYCQEVLSTQDVRQNPEELQVHMSPNPTMDVVQVKTSVDLKPFAQVYDTSGKMMGNFIIVDGKIDFSRLGPGNYFIVFESVEGISRTIKLLKK